MVGTLSKALCRIADALPRYERTAELFRTKEIQEGTANLYALFMKFLVRAMQWYQGGSFKHAIHAFVKPVAIAYKDILEEIEESSRSLDQWVATAAYAEQRAMHLEQRYMYREQQAMRLENHGSHLLLEEVRQLVLAMQPQLAQLQAGQNQLSTVVFNTNDLVHDAQLSSMLTFAAGVPGLDPQERLRLSLLMRNRRRTRPAHSRQSFTQSTKLRTWTLSHQSALVLVRGSIAVHTVAKEFCVDVIQYLQSASIPVLWILNDPMTGGRKSFSAIDLLRSLVFQALQLNTTLHNEKSCSINCARMQSARTELEWIDILGAAMAGMPQVYIVVDVEAQRSDMPSLNDSFSWSMAFHTLFQKLAARNCPSIIKVVLVSYSAMPRIFAFPSSFPDSDAVIPISTILKPTAKRMPKQARLSLRIRR